MRVVMVTAMGKHEFHEVPKLTAPRPSGKLLVWDRQIRCYLSWLMTYPVTCCLCARSRVEYPGALARDRHS